MFDESPATRIIIKTPPQISMLKMIQTIEHVLNSHKFDHHNDLFLYDMNMDPNNGKILCTTVKKLN